MHMMDFSECFISIQNVHMFLLSLDNLIKHSGRFSDPSPALPSKSILVPSPWRPIQPCRSHPNSLGGGLGAAWTKARCFQGGARPVGWAVALGSQCRHHSGTWCHGKPIVYWWLSRGKEKRLSFWWNKKAASSVFQLCHVLLPALSGREKTPCTRLYKHTVLLRAHPSASLIVVGDSLYNFQETLPLPSFLKFPTNV